VAVLAVVFIIHHRFNFDYDDAILICGFAVIILGFLITRNYEHTLPPISPVGKINSGIGGSIMHTAMVESALKDYEHHNEIHKKKPVKIRNELFYFLQVKIRNDNLWSNINYNRIDQSLGASSNIVGKGDI